MSVSQLPTPPQPHDLLLQTLAALAEQQPAQLPAGIALARCRALMAASQRLSAVTLEALSDLNTRELYALDAAPSAAAWVDAQGIVGIDRSQLALAKRLAKNPLVAEELRGGRLSPAAAALVALALAKARPFTDRTDGLIDGLPAEDVLYGVIVDGISGLLAEQHGGFDTQEQAEELRGELEALWDAPATEQTRLESALVLLAQRSQPALLRSALDLLLDALLPLQHDKRAAKADDDAALRLTRRHGGSGWDLLATLPDETGELLWALLAHELATDPDAPADTAAVAAAASGASAGDDLLDLDPEHWPTTSRDGTALPPPRSRKRQHADAFGRILQNAATHSSADSSTTADGTDAYDHGATPADSDGTETGGTDAGGTDLALFGAAAAPAAPPTPAAAESACSCAGASAMPAVRPWALPHLIMTVSLDVAHGVPGALPARSLSGARWSRTQVRQLLCHDTRLTRHVLDLRGRVLEASHTGRTLKAHERLIKATETGNVCQRRGCPHGPATGHPIVPHHPEAYSRTPITSVHDTANVCEPDHNALHRHGRVLTLGNGRMLGPDGWLPRRT